MCRKLIYLVPFVLALMSVPVFGDDPILAPGDFIIAIDADGGSRSPDNEQVGNAIDRTTNKYLNFGDGSGGDEQNTGFIVTPALGSSVVGSFEITTANDAEERDPATWALYGTNQPIVSANHSTGTSESWTLIASGSVILPTARNTLGPLVVVNNSTSYKSYKMLFTTVKNAGTANSMQIAEIQFYGASENATNPQPTDGSTVDADSEILTWDPGLHAALHDVYVSTSFADVNTATTSSGDVYKGRQSELKYPFDPCDLFAAMPLIRGATYYWRIDEVNGVNTWRGDIWSFWVLSNINWGPNPADQAKFVPVTTDLSWGKGNLAKVGHIIYLSTDFATVDNKVPGTIGGAGYLGATSYAVTTFAIPGDLLYNTTYYWRADAVEKQPMATPGNTHKGTVWSFTTLPFIPISDDPNLVGWWTFDEGEGGTALDWSGHGNNGTLTGAPQHVAGKIDGALELNGSSDYVDCGYHASLNITGAVTISAWINLAAGARDQKIAGNMDNTTGGYKMGVYTDDNLEFEIRDSTGVGALTRGIGGTVLTQGVWHHVVAVYSEAGGYMRTYVDGNLDKELVTTTLLGGSSGALRLGREPYSSANFFNGVLDDVRVYNKALSAAEIRVMGGFLEAWDPIPANEAYNVSAATTIDWLEGPLAVSHNVYFGTSYADVEAGTGGTFKGSQLLGNHAYDPPGDLEAGKLYYWKIDEVNDLHPDKKWEGPVWVFRVAGGAGGLLGSYYNDTSPGGFETFVLSRIDPEINFNWGDPGSPDPLVNVDLFTCRWTGQVEAQFSEDYIFYPASDDGARLWVDGQLVIDQWVDRGTTENASAPISLVAGQKYDIRMEQYENGGGATAYLGWSSPSTSKRIIPGIWLWPPTKATNPTPANGSTTAPPQQPTLSWTAGVYAAAANGHRVYFDADEARVIARAGCQVNNVSTTNPSYLLPYTFGLQETYYWAVDEVNGVTWPGDVWSFTTANNKVVDDMETYTFWQIPGNNIVDAWTDGIGDCVSTGNGTGSTIYEYPGFSFGGVQSMKYDYDNDGMAYNPCDDLQGPRTYKYSKIVAQVANLPSGIGSDWAAGGVKALSLRFYGDPNSVAVIEPMWVELTDWAGAHAKVTYGDYEDEDPDDIAEAAWHEWLIDLDDFTGVNMSNVKSIAIGIGLEDDIGPYGSGRLYFDDIRLYTPQCVLARRSADFAKFDYAPEGAASGDCKVDYKELAIMSRDWATGDRTVDPQAISVGPVAWYQFENNANDSSGNGNNGTENNGPFYSAGHISGQAIDLDGVDDYVSTGKTASNLGINGNNPRTVTAWVYTRAFNNGAIFDVGNRATGEDFSLRTLVDATHLAADQWWRIQYWGGDYDFRYDALNKWVHFAHVHDGAGTKIYADGRLIVDWVKTLNTTDTNPFQVGLYGWPDSYFNGLIDDLRLYNYALTEGQVLTSAGMGSTYMPVPSPANLVDPEDPDSRYVNFRDYAALLLKWLDETEWPLP